MSGTFGTSAITSVSTSGAGAAADGTGGNHGEPTGTIGVDDVVGAADDLGGPRVHGASGVADLTVPDEVGALRTAVRFAPHVAVLPADAAPAAALTVLAEGKDSASRAQRGVRFERQAYGQTALAARLTSDLPHGHLARQWFQSPDILALLPFDRPMPGRSLALVWSLPPERALALRDAPAAEFEAALAAATGGEAGALQLQGPRACWPLALAQASAVSGPGWALVGDAAHQVHPLAGQGLNLGLADVSALAAVIAAREPWRALGDERLLRRYERARAAPTQAMSWLTDGLQRLFAEPQPLVKELRNRGLTLLNHLAPLKRALTARALDS